MAIAAALAGYEAMGSDKAFLETQDFSWEMKKKPEGFELFVQKEDNDVFLFS